jgi:hypothetical protein
VVLQEVHFFRLKNNITEVTKYFKTNCTFKNKNERFLQSRWKRLFCCYRYILFQCCQLAEISTAKHKRGRIKISAAGKIRGRIFCRFVKNWPKSGRTFFGCATHIKALIIGRNGLFNTLMNSTFCYFFAAEVFLKQPQYKDIVCCRIFRLI